MNFQRPVDLIFGECVFRAGSPDFPLLAEPFKNEKIVFDARPSKGGEEVFMRLRLVDSERAAALAEKNGIVFTLVKARGLPVLFSGYLKRYGLIAGVLAGLAVMVVSQLFVWSISIAGNDKVPKSEILSALGQCGVKVGAFIPPIDSYEKANEFLMICRDISSCTVSIDGNRMTVTVLERAPVPEIADTKGYYNVVASRDGVIVDIDAADGTPEVKEGDTVVEGQLLINSFIAGNNGTFRPTHARGRVLAEVREKYEITVPLERSFKRFTGNSSSKRRMILLGTEFDLCFNDSSPYEYFDTVVSEKDIKLFGTVELPAESVTVTYYEYVPEKELISFAAAESIAREELANALAEAGGEISGCEVETVFDEEKGACVLTADAALIVEIGVEREYTLNGYRISERLPSARE